MNFKELSLDLKTDLDFSLFKRKKKRIICGTFFWKKKEKKTFFFENLHRLLKNHKNRSFVNANIKKEFHKTK